jgi:beta-lactamase superfamily II metal-dependent hydrolase
MGSVKRSPTLTVVDVGHGNAAVVTDGARVLMIDVGGRNTILEYCRRERIRTVDTVLISHADEDHVGGLIALLASSEIHLHRVRVNPDATKHSAVWDDLLWELESAAERGEIDFRPSLTVADDGDFDLEDVRVEILAPSRHLAAKGAGSRTRARRRVETNTISVIVRIAGSATTVLACGDVDAAGLWDATHHKRDLRASVLIFPHHGGFPGTDAAAFAEELVTLVVPEVVIFSIGRNRAPSMPRPDIIAAIRQTVPSVRIACTQLSTQCAGSIPSSEPAHLVNTYARGKDTRRCCGGTIRISLGQSRISPSAASHGTFIDANAPSALCRRSFEN